MEMFAFLLIGDWILLLKERISSLEVKSPDLKGFKYEEDNFILFMIKLKSIDIFLISPQRQVVGINHFVIIKPKTIVIFLISSQRQVVGICRSPSLMRF